MPEVNSPVSDLSFTTPVASPLAVAKPDIRVEVYQNPLRARVYITPKPNATHSTVALANPVLYPGDISDVEIVHAINSEGVPGYIGVTTPAGGGEVAFDFSGLDAEVEYRVLAFSKNIGA